MLVDAFTDTVKNALEDGQDVRLIRFGAFLSAYVSAKEGHNPQTGEPIKIGARNQSKFRPSEVFKDCLNN